MSAFDMEVDSDPSIEELREQLDAFVNRIQEQLRMVADSELPSDHGVSAENGSDGGSPLGRLSAIKQRLAARMETCDES